MNGKLATREKINNLYLSLLPAGRGKISFLPWNDTGISATPGQASCSDIVCKHIKDSTGFLYVLSLGYSLVPPPPGLVVLFYCLGLRHFISLCWVFEGFFFLFFFLSNNLKLCR